ncbi:hypothetical protein BH11PAT2_BH11PAT2_03520 [soil metagenome]
MPSRFAQSQVSIRLDRVESWEIEEILKFHRSSNPGEDGRVQIEGQLLTFGTDEYVDELGWREEKICQEGEARCLPDILLNLLAKDALSVTLLSEFYSNGDGLEEQSPDYEELAEQIPTLVLQEVLAKRIGAG